MEQLMRWLYEALGEITISPDDCPVQRVGKGEEIVGEVIDSTTRKLFVLSNRLVEQTHEMSKGLMEQKGTHPIGQRDHDRKKCSFCRRVVQAEILNRQARLVDEMFWSAVFMNLTSESVIKQSHLSDRQLVICRGWKIVLRRESRSVVPVIYLPPRGTLHN